MAPKPESPSGAQAVRSYIAGSAPTPPTPFPRTQRILIVPGLLVPPVPTRSRKRFLASTEALLMLRAGARPSRWLQSCRRPWSASWGSCNSLHSNSICVGDTEDTQLPLLGRVGNSNGRQGPGEGMQHRAGRDATVGGAWRGGERKPHPRAPWEAGETGRCRGDLRAGPVSPRWDYIHEETAGPLGAPPAPPAPGEANPM